MKLLSIALLLLATDANAQQNSVWIGGTTGTTGTATLCFVADSSGRCVSLKSDLVIMQGINPRLIRQIEDCETVAKILRKSTDIRTAECFP